MARAPKRPRRSRQRRDRPKEILDYVLAIGTLCVALATLALVWVTHDVATQTRELAKADIRPVLGDVPLGAPPTTITYDRGGINFPQSFRLADGAAIDTRAWQEEATAYAGRSIAVRNIGKGPARVEAIQITLFGTTERYIAAWSTIAIVPAGGTARILTLQSNENHAPLDSIPFTITVEYSDISEHQRQIAIVHVVPNYYKIGGLRLYSFRVKNV